MRAIPGTLNITDRTFIFEATKYMILLVYKNIKGKMHQI